MTSRLATLVSSLAGLSLGCGVDDTNAWAEIQSEPESSTEQSEGAICSSTEWCVGAPCVYDKNLGPGSVCQVGAFVKPEPGLPTGRVEKMVAGTTVIKSYTRSTASFGDATAACTSLLRRTMVNGVGLNYDTHVGFQLEPQLLGPHGERVTRLTCKFENFQCYPGGSCLNTSLSSTSTTRTRQEFVRIDACADWTPPVLTLPTTVITVRESTADGRSFIYKPAAAQFGARDFRPCEHRPTVTCTNLHSGGRRSFWVSSTTTSPQLLLPKDESGAQWAFECSARDLAGNVAVGTVIIKGQ